MEFQGNDFGCGLNLKGPAAILGLGPWMDYYLFPLVNLHLFWLLVAGSF